MIWDVVDVICRIDVFFFFILFSKLVVLHLFFLK